MSFAPNFLVIILALSFLSSWSGVRQETHCTGLDEGVELVQSYWLDDARFIEGLFYDIPSDRFFESFGLPGESGIRSYTLDDYEQEVTDIQFLYANPPEEFAEGIAVVGNTLYQLTYRSGIIHVFEDYLSDELIESATMAIPRDQNWEIPEGWGLTSDGTFLYMTDGSARIFRINPENLQPFDQEEHDRLYDAEEWPEEAQFDHIYTVLDPETGERLNNLNEMEMVGSEIYVNILDFSVQTFLVARIEVAEESMTVVRIYDFCLLHELVCDALDQANIDHSCSSVREMNGIAYYNPENAFVLTGKEWPAVYMVTLDDNTAI